MLDNERKTKIVSVLGMPRCDIPYYIIRLLNAYRKDVLVIDNSKEHSLFRSFRKVEGEEVVSFGHIWIMYDRVMDEEFFKEFDVVIVFHGLRIEQMLLDNSDVMYLLTDYNPFNIEKIKTALSVIEEKYLFRVIAVDQVTSKYSDEKIIQELGLVKEQVIRFSTVFHNESDAFCYINFMRSGSQQIKNTSAEMKEILKQVLPDIYEEDDAKELTKAYKKALAGKIR